jgi:hypothetical protein
MDDRGPWTGHLTKPTQICYCASGWIARRNDSRGHGSTRRTRWNAALHEKGWMNMHQEFLAQMVRAFAQGNRNDEKWQEVTRETAAQLVKALPGPLIRDAAELNDVLPPAVDKVGFRSEPEFALTYRNCAGVLSIGEGGQKHDFIISDRTHPELDPVSKVHIAVYGYSGFVR